MPTRLAYAVAIRVADLCFVCFRGPRRKLVANLTRVVGDEAAERVARLVFRQYARYIIDLFQLPALGLAAVRARTDFSSWDDLESVVAEGKGTILVTLHFGQQETGGAALAAHGYKVSVVARTLEFGPINGLVQGFRAGMGMNIIPAENGKLQTFRCLARNEVLGMLIDLVDPGEGVLVEFLGGKAQMSSAPARIALRTGARVVPGVVVRDAQDDRRFMPVIDAGLRFQASGDEEADALALTQLIAHSLEGFVRRFPDQWFAFRPVWRDEPPPPEPETRFNDRLNHLALELANVLFREMPKPAAYAIAAAVGTVAFHARRRVRADVEDNMRRVLGPEAPADLVSRQAREVFKNVCRYYADLIRMPRTKPHHLLEKEMTVEGVERLRQTMQGRGAVVATAHFGNPEVAVQISALLGLEVLVLSEPLNPPAFSDLVHRLRESEAARYEEVGFKAIGRAMAHLRGGGVLAITCDRDIQGTGAPLPFFGEVTRIPLGAAELAARTGAALVPAYCKRVGHGYNIVFEDPIELVSSGQAKADAVAATMAMIERMERWIRSDPGQWMVLERIWTGPPRSRSGRGKPALGATMAASGER